MPPHFRIALPFLMRFCVLFFSLLVCVCSSNARLQSNYTLDDDNQTDRNGLGHMRARFYNPLIRRFVNADPAQRGNQYTERSGGSGSFSNFGSYSEIYHHDSPPTAVGFDTVP